MPISNLFPQTSQPGVNHDVTLLSTGWIDKKQAISIPGVSANEYDDWISFTPKEDSKEAVNAAQLMMESQSEDSVTFIVTNLPSEDLNIVVNIQGAVKA